ncbi:uncharacterized protein LOC134190265 isoform X3 [Corticium candelabrum]|uniref:uncharacterized protein LOC134190265 isoform X3 n=1 Tax=Corticium candelabrum TaxID=121492 RepID=UPI002E26ED34|nr:uncharacterized protein LOC134190265 isoform X3 [Corticium candelabrum]
MAESLVEVSSGNQKASGLDDKPGSVHSSLQQVIADASKVVSVNILGVRGRELWCASEIFGMKKYLESTYVSEDLTKGVQLMQVLGAGKVNQLHWLTATEPIKGEGMEATIVISCLAPLIVVIPLDQQVIGEDSSLCFPEIKKLLVSAQAGRSPLVVIGICKYSYDERVLKHVVMNTLGIRTDHMLFVLESSDHLMLSSICTEINKVLTKSLLAAESSFLEVDKAILLERCKKTKILTLDQFRSRLTEDVTDVQLAQFTLHLEQTSLVMCCPFVNTEGDVYQREQYMTSTIVQSRGVSVEDSLVGASYTKGADLNLILDPKLFAIEVDKNIELCRLFHAETNNCLIPAVRHNLIPKSKLSQIFQVLLPALHRASKVLNPLFVACGHADCSEKIYIIVTEPQSQLPVIPDARSCVLLPSCLEANQLVLPLIGYHRIPPLAFRSPGHYKRDIPIPVFYQLIAFLMKHFPSFVKCCAHAAKFNIADQHVLEVSYAETYIKAVVYVRGTVSPITPTICDGIRIMIRDHLDMLLKTSGVLVICQAAVLHDSNSTWSDFVDLIDFDPYCTNQELCSIGGQLFSPTDDFFLWFGKLGPKPSEIQKSYMSIKSDIDPVRALTWLYERQLIIGSELDRMLDQNADMRLQALLLLLENKGARGLEIIDAILHDNTLKKHQRLTVETETEIAQIGEGRRHQQAHRVMAASPMQEPSLTAKADSHSKPGDHEISRNVGQTDADLNYSTLESTRKEQLNQLGIKSLQSRSAQQSQESSITSTTSLSAIYAGLQEEQIAIPRSSLTVVQTITRTTDSELSSEREPSITEVKRDPEVHPIFESKYWHVERATNSFNEVSLQKGGKRLGVGSFGTVFHGVLHSETGQKFEVAVKRLKKATSLNPAQVKMSRKQFGTEMNVLTRYLHKNIIRLVGFSSDGPELCLIYEYMSRGPLSHRLDCKDNTLPLDWRVRLTIGQDIASALEFLHTAFRLPVVHRDVKSSNILLGSHFEAKLSDFGLAVIWDSDGDQQPEDTGEPSYGTRAYMAPESLQGLISTKGDVYSLGMKAYLEDMERQKVNIVKMLDPKARWPISRRGQGKDSSYGLDLLKIGKMAAIGDHTNRPDIVEVLLQLTALISNIEQS